MQRLWLGVLMLSSAHPASAETFNTTFFSRGKSIPIAIEKALVVTTTTGTAQTAQPDWPGLNRLGFAVVERNVAQAKSIVGYPMRFSHPQSEAILTHEIVVKLNAPTGLAGLISHPDFLSYQETPFKSGLLLAKFSSPLAALKAANDLYRNKAIAYAHPNFMMPKDIRKKAPAPDPLFAKQWHLENTGQSEGINGADISVLEAWDISQGSPQTLVAVVDTGFFADHPDLIDAWNTNLAETANNGRDDDGNGYIDDVKGWNFYRRNNQMQDSEIIDHGTAVSGIIGARKNGIGVTGVCPECRLLPIVLAFDVLRDAEAIHYAWRNGAAVISNSWGYPVGTPETDVLVEAIADAATQGRNGLGSIVTFAMSNLDTNDCDGSMPDISSLDTVIAVSSSSDLDRKVQTAGWGECMELLSPSKEKRRTGIVTTDLLGGRGYNNGQFEGNLEDLDYTNSFSGTSAATPTVSGVAALMLSINPDLTRDQIVVLLTTTADKINPGEARYDPVSGFSRTYGYGRLNAQRACAAAAAAALRTSKL